LWQPDDAGRDAVFDFGDPLSALIAYQLLFLSILRLAFFWLINVGSLNSSEDRPLIMVIVGIRVESVKSTLVNI
jgi:hypothetical protein